MRLVEVAESRAPRVDQMDTGVAGPRRERLDFNPAADSAATTSLSTGVLSKRAQPSRSATSVPRIAPRARRARPSLTA